MIGMQYSFVLPTDYDMSVISHRIQSKAQSFDGMEGLLFKAFLTASVKKNGIENLYAPFYVWKCTRAMETFLCSEAFAGVTRSFGWAKTDTWLSLANHADGDLGRATFAVRTITPIQPYSDLSVLRQKAQEETRLHKSKTGRIAAFAGIDPTHWRLVQFELFDCKPEVAEPVARLYEVSYLAS